MIEFENVSKVYPDGTVAIEDVSFVVDEGTTTVLVGPSGCGKTTTMKLVNRLEDPTEGTVYYDEVDTQKLNATELRRDIGYVIQEIGLFDHMTVAENVATVPKLKGWQEERIENRVDELLELMNLSPSAYRTQYPNMLSGGQRQRVGVARALAADPDVLLMDEPFGALDPITREDLQDEFLEIQKEINTTILFVTHSIDEALKMGDKIAIYNEGYLVQYDTPKRIVNDPASGFVEDFVGQDRLLKKLSLTTIGDVMVTDDRSQGAAVDGHGDADELGVSPEESLKTALVKFVDFDVTELPVISGDEVVAIVRKESIFDVYGEEGDRA